MRLLLHSLAWNLLLLVATSGVEGSARVIHIGDCKNRLLYRKLDCHVKCEVDGCPYLVMGGGYTFHCKFCKAEGDLENPFFDMTRRRCMAHDGKNPLPRF
ncbi:hypothetical protein PCASD_23810 [Puccinia coronata f. sp. avenae]|uniref:Cyanovirin-N domain-containing protein n=1 Tax=Puccinia coronata f. sp. avenae TaxID=200324 RepID=A0A2N5RYD5_9BASI|nr:hypothetical protein PCASD_23810 [Puccinia coronata f. sp. avenae]